MKELQWKLFGPWSNDLIDDKNYNVTWKRSDGHFACPHLAYWIEEEKRFFSLQHNDSFPIQVDMYIELPELPQ